MEIFEFNVFLDKNKPVKNMQFWFTANSTQLVCSFCSVATASSYIDNGVNINVLFYCQKWDIQYFRGQFAIPSACDIALMPFNSFLITAVAAKLDPFQLKELFQLN